MLYLKENKTFRAASFGIPMFFMMAVTLQTWNDNYRLDGQLFTTGLTFGMTLQLIFAVLLLCLGVIVAIQGVKKLFEKSDKTVEA